MKNKSYQGRFVAPKIDICVDGKKEVWELEEVCVVESKMFVTYKLKGTEKYQTGV